MFVNRVLGNSCNRVEVHLPKHHVQGPSLGERTWYGDQSTQFLLCNTNIASLLGLAALSDTTHGKRK
jgi:hypothetical protein